MELNASFAFSLQTKHKPVFLSGHRLSVRERGSIMVARGTMSMRRQGFRFSDEPTSCLPMSTASRSSACAALRSKFKIKRPLFRVHSILRVLWFTVDPLVLELWVDTFRNGANLMYDGPRYPGFQIKNSRSAIDNVVIFSSFIQKEIEAGWAVGFFSSPPFPNSFVSPCAIVPKDGPKKYRLVDDWSRPQSPWGKSINECIQQVFCQFDKFDAVVAQFIMAGRGCWLFKGDFAHAYRQCFIRALDHHLCVGYVPGKGFFFRPRLCFGNRSSGWIWERVVKCFLALLDAVFKITDVFHWVDDLFKCVKLYSCAIALFKACMVISVDFGFEAEITKFFVGQRLAYTGITFNSVDMSLSISQEKRKKSSTLLSALLSISLWSFKDFEKLAGHFGHYGKIIPALRPFCSRVSRHMHAAFKMSKSKSKRAKVFSPGGLHQDALMFQAIISDWSGTVASSTLTSDLVSSDFIFEVDSSPLWGMGIFSVSSGHWCSSKFTSQMLKAAFISKTHSSTFLELLPVCVLLSTFSALLSNKRIILRMDSKNAVAGLVSRHSSKNPRTCSLLRIITVQEAEVGCRISAIHIPRALNKASDALSHNNLQVVCSLFVVPVLPHAQGFFLCSLGCLSFVYICFTLVHTSDVYLAYFRFPLYRHSWRPSA